jgi:hypothetical protein
MITRGFIFQEDSESITIYFRFQISTIRNSQQGGRKKDMDLNSRINKLPLAAKKMGGIKTLISKFSHDARHKKTKTTTQHK